ncbi:MAG TPA: hypothetical protein DCF68_07855 [Cyanothece sp. UBA12306]|nr:hypothetical protein [Cyanothece sp. UBA12306]
MTILILFMVSEKTSWQNFYKLLFILLLILILTAHLLQLANIPVGFFADETSIGYNAALISQTGIDEHGVYYPVYFEAFGEYKNPIYIYATALIFKIFGISEFNLRLTSFIFYIAALIFTLLLVFKVFRRNKTVAIYTLISLGFLPIFFISSRISFEVISQLTWISAANLCIWTIFDEEKKGKLEYFKTLVCGLIIGTSIYTYSTARLLSFLMLISLWIIYFKRENIKKLALITLTFLTSLIPYILFTINNPEATTTRFKTVSYIDDPISIIDKVGIFVNNFASYLSPEFLIKHGDPNLRHSTGYGGIIFASILFLFLITLIYIVFNKRFNKFQIFLFFNLLLSPATASLTSEGTPHALRSFLLGYYILLFSCYSMELISQMRNKRIRKVVIIFIFSFLLFEIVGNQLYFFGFYPSKSVHAMVSFDLKKSLQIAIEQKPQEIIFVNEPTHQYSNLKFYSYLVKNPTGIPIKMTLKPVTVIPLHSCMIYHEWSEKELDQFPYSFTEYKSNKSLNFLEKLLGVKSPPNIMRVRCYK